MFFDLKILKIFVFPVVNPVHHTRVVGKLSQDEKCRA